MEYFINHYLENKVQALNWEVSPLFAPNLENMPETYIFAAGLDPLLDEGIAYKKRLEFFGNKVTYKLYPGQIHGFLSNSKSKRERRSKNLLGFPTPATAWTCLCIGQLSTSYSFPEFK